MNNRNNIPAGFRASLAILLLSWLLFSCETENNIKPVSDDYFFRLYGDEGRQEGIDLVVNAADQSVVLLGTTTTVQGSKRVFVVKADWNGNLLWKRKLGGPSEQAKDIEPTSDGGYIILTETRDLTAVDQSENIKLIKINGSGDKQDSVVYGSPERITQSDEVIAASGPGIDKPATVTVLDDGYLVTGTVGYEYFDELANTITDFAYLTVRFHADLEPDLTFDVGPVSQAELSYGFKTIQTSDRVYVMGSDNQSIDGVPANFNMTFFDLNAFGISSTGTQWMGINQEGIHESISAVCPSLGGGFFVVGEQMLENGQRKIFTAGLGYEDGKLIKGFFNGSLAIPNTGSNGVNITPTSVCPSSTGVPGYIIMGTEGAEGNRNIWLTKVAANGSTVLWSTIIGAGGRNDDRAGTVAELPNGKIVATGTVNVGVNNLKMGFFKLNGNGSFDQ